MSMILSWAALSIAFGVSAMLLPGLRLSQGGDAIWVAGLFGLLNYTLGWLLFGLIGLGTMGLGFVFALLTRWLVSAILLKLTDALMDGLHIDGFGTALLGALIITLVGTVVERILLRMARSRTT